MGIEIERKFRVANDGWRTRVVARKRIAQAYLTQGGVASIRIRIIDDSRATLTIKGSRARLARDEFEYDIPVADARQMMKLRTGLVVEKVRHDVMEGADLWEVDVFTGVHEGLMLAEIELANETATFALPAWLGREVTGEQEWYNSTLAQSAVPVRAAGLSRQR